MSMDLLSWELPIVCQWISSISYSFRDKLVQKGQTKAQFQSLSFFILRRGLKGDQNPKFCIFGSHTLEK
jgi:hypothetical protein